MKISIILFGVLCGYFFPNDTFSIELFVTATLSSFAIGFVFSDMMNANFLANKDDLEKVTFKSKISIFKTNTISFWVGVFVFFMAMTTVTKHILLNNGFNHLGIIVLFFSFGAFLRLKKTNLSLHKLFKN